MVCLANQKLCYIQILLNIEKYGEYDKERSKEWLVNMDLDTKMCESIGRSEKIALSPQYFTKRHLP